MGKKDPAEEITIKAAAELVGVRESALRYYERKKLIRPRRTEAGYRMYSPEDIARIRNILLLRHFDFTVDEIRAALDDPDFSAERLIAGQYEVQQAKIRHAEQLAGIAQMVQLTGVIMPDEFLHDGETEAEKPEIMERRWNMPRLMQKVKEMLPQIHPKKIPQIKVHLAAVCALRGTEPPDSDAVLAQIDGFYAVCTEIFGKLPPVLFHILVRAYASDGAMAASLNLDYGEGAAVYFSEALAAWCARQEESEDSAET